MMQLPKKNSSKLNFAAPQWAVLIFVAACLALLLWDMYDGSLSGSLTAEAPVVKLPLVEGRDAEKGEVASVLAITEGETDAIRNETDMRIDGESASFDHAAFFADYRLEREQTKARELELLEQTLANKESSVAAKTTAEQSRIEIVETLAAELKAETILAAKKFGESVVIIGIKQATVIVDGEIDGVKAAQIAEIVEGVCDIGYENVIIVNP
ncbi:MAG: SpoIIIAH-like family protein [Clostridiales bacterium]